MTVIAITIVFSVVSFFAGMTAQNPKLPICIEQKQECPHLYDQCKLSNHYQCTIKICK